MAVPAKHYTVRRLAEERWGCSLSHVYDLIDNRQLKALRIGKTLRIPIAFVEEYEMEHHAWEDQSESESNTASKESENISISAGQKIANLSAFRLGQEMKTQPRES